jgi:hypothetical protein
MVLVDVYSVQLPFFFFSGIIACALASVHIYLYIFIIFNFLGSCSDTLCDNWFGWGKGEIGEKQRRGRRQESMDVEAVVSVVIRKLTDLLIQESIIFNKATDEVELVRISLRKMQNFLIDAEDKKEGDDEVKKWMEEFLNVVYKVEDAIETFVLWRMHTRRIGFTRSHLFFITRKLKADGGPRNEREIKKKIKEVKLEIDKMKEKMGKIKNENIEELGYSRAQRIRESKHGDSLRVEEYSIVEDESDVIGFKEHKRKLVTNLTYTSYQRLDVISIVGAVGSGKTTLATEIYNSSEIKGYFDCRAWVSASENLTDVLRSILEQTNNSTVDKDSNPEELVKKLRENLQNKRYLVVLDDVRRLDVLKDLRDALPKETDCSRVLLTTSNDDDCRFTAISAQAA